MSGESGGAVMDDTMQDYPLLAGPVDSEALARATDAWRARCAASALMPPPRLTPADMTFLKTLRITWGDD